MKFYCLAYYDEARWRILSEGERNAFIDECFTYDDQLRKDGHFAGGDGLQGSDAAVTMEWKEGKVSISRGPYARTAQQLGGILVLEARDLDHAIELISRHPGISAGPFEIRAVEDMSAMILDSERRRARKIA